MRNIDSTDDVFDGKSDQPYNEFDQTRPQTAYGKSKLAGEQYVKEFTYKHFIIRSTHKKEVKCNNSILKNLISLIGYNKCFCDYLFYSYL